LIKNLKIKLNKKNISRYCILISCIILTSISLTLALSSSDYLFKHRLPEDNFVTLITEVYATTPCDQNSEGFEYEILNNEELCEGELLMSSRASGGVIRQINDSSYILTAAHFCDIQDVDEIFRYSNSPVFIENRIYKDGNYYSFSVLKSDSRRDICLVESDYEVTEDLKLARKMPELGDQTITISSPLGVAQKNINMHFSGIFSGCNYPECFFTIPAISGSSGSLILNSKNEVIGLTQSALIGFPNLTIGLGIYDIRKFLYEFQEESDIDLIDL